MADYLKQASIKDIQLIVGSRGIFDVEHDGKVIYSKYETGRFPRNEEILNLLGMG